MRNPLRPLRFLPQGRENKPLVPWVIAVMMFLCGIGLIIGISLNGVLAQWSGQLQNAMTVQVTVADTAERERQAAAALALLQQSPGIAQARRMDKEAVARLLEPWLGRGNVVADLPIPALIEISLVPGRSVNIRALRARLEQAAPAAILDDHGQWLGQVLALSRVVQAIALAIVLMLLLATVAVVIFGARAGLAGHRRSVEIMHLMGAGDRVIVGEFQFQYFLYGLIGGIAGSMACGLLLLVINYLTERLSEGLLPSLAAGSGALIILLSLPVFAATIATLTARQAILSDLQRMV